MSVPDETKGLFVVMAAVRQKPLICGPEDAAIGPNYTMEEEENKIKAMTNSELVADAGVAYSQTISEFFSDRCTNFSLLGEIASIKRKEMEWPMPYNQQTAFVHSCAASLEMMAFVADEVKKCCQVMQTVLEENIGSEKSYAILFNAMSESVNRINKELERQIEFVQSLNEDENEE